MNRTLSLNALFLALILLPVAAGAQGSGTISGSVVDQTTNQPLSGVQIFLAGTSRGSLTNQQGRYLIPGVPTGQHEVRANLIGYSQGTQRVTVAAGQTATADFTLSPSAVELGAVVVTATGQQQRTREIGNAVSTINVAEVELAAVPSMAALLQARSPGVVVTQNSGTTGTAGRIRIRGSNSVSLSNEPLFIVDGMRITGSEQPVNSASLTAPYHVASPLNDINPEDIESIEILKGPAAAAMYGTAAANGVIQITTKRGRAGRVRWNSYIEQGLVTDPTEYPASFRGDCLLLEVAEGDCDEVTGIRSFNTLEHPDFTPFRDGHRQQYGLNVSGGSEAVTYYVSGEYEDEQGVYQLDGIDGNSLRRFGLRTNLNAALTSTLNIGLRVGFTNNDLVLPRNDNDLYGVLLNGLLGSADSTENRGTYGIPHEESFAFRVGQESRRFIGGINGDYQPFSWLSLNGTLGLDQQSRHDNEYVGANQVSGTFGALVTEGYRRSNRADVSNLTGTLSGTVTHALTEALLSTTSLGGQYHREEFHDTRAFGRGMAPGTESLQGASRLFEVSENSIENATLGAFVQQQLGWQDRLFLTAALRGDDNSAFGSEADFVWYPSLSASWVASEEPFFPEIGLLSNLRLRAAYGKSGLRPSFRDAIAYFRPISVRVTGNEVPGVTLGNASGTEGTGNINLRPEVSREIELGFDAGLFNERVGLEVTYYNKLSEDALIQRRLAPSLGLTVSRFENVGSVSNKGFEALLNARVIETAPVRWDVTVSASTNRNRLEELGEGIEPIITGSNRQQQRHTPGLPLGGYWGRPITFADANGDGLLQISEVSLGDTAEYLGQPMPTRELSLSSSLELFGWLRMSGLLDYKGGNKQHNFTRFDRCTWELLCEEAYVRESSTLRDQAGVIAFNVLDPGVNTVAYLEDADFVKLRELSLTLSVPDRFTSRYGASGVRLTLSGRNLATWTDYTGFDPEVNGYGAFDGGFQTYDYYTQPPLRYFIARVDVNF